MVNANAHPDYLPAAERGAWPLLPEQVIRYTHPNRRSATPLSDARTVAQVIYCDHLRRTDGKRYTQRDIAQRSMCSQQVVNLNWHRFHRRAPRRVMEVYIRSVVALQRQGYTLRNLEARYICPDAD